MWRSQAPLLGSTWDTSPGMLAPAPRRQELPSGGTHGDFCATKWGGTEKPSWFNGDLMGFNSDLMGFNGDLMGFNGI